jgi:uncharacterized protein (TIGR00162 family)
MSWKVKVLKKVGKPKNLFLVEGLPGIGNVGKIAVDFIIDSLKAEKIYSFNSYKMPNCVFVNEDNLIEIPSIEIYQKKIKGKTLFLITGDSQPLDEVSCYEFCNILLDLCKKNNCKEIITLGGLGVPDVPTKPRLYYTGNSKDIIKKYGGRNDYLGGVGPIIGVSGLLVGLAKQRKINGVTILAETFRHPHYLGVKGAKEVLKVLDKKIGLGLDFKRVNKEMKDIENKLNFDENLFGREKIDKIEEKMSDNPDVTYIG